MNKESTICDYLMAGTDAAKEYGKSGLIFRYARLFHSFDVTLRRYGID